MIMTAAVLLGIASILMFVVSLWCFVQWFDEVTYKPRMRRSK
jgi:hypothetical protein